ncbi:hypothetical protein ACN2XU_17555 [Primorskyibacter sp. 2E107]|uniref:hypothetical protein n=1 Tax=Primorskyibacter sp. 2E107 TaxID=3403458 RepID=UPI003AF5A3AB
MKTRPRFTLFAMILAMPLGSIAVTASAQNNGYAPADIPPENHLRLEQMLRIAGYPTGPVDGTFDVTSSRALFAYGRENGYWRTKANFTMEIYDALADHVAMIERGEVSQIRPNWEVEGWELTDALRKIGCYGPNFDESRDVDRQARREAQAATALDDPSLTRLDIDFSSGMDGRAYVKKDCAKPELRIYADLSREPSRGGLEKLIDQMERKAGVFDEPCGDVRQVTLTTYAEGNRILDFEYNLYDGNSTSRVNPERHSLGATRVFAAWEAARNGDFESLSNGLDETAFFGTLRNADLMRSIQDGSYMSIGASSNFKQGLIFAWQWYLEDYQDICIQGGLDNVTVEEFTDGGIQKLTSGLSRYLQTSTNTQTGDVRVQYALTMKNKFAETYLASVNGGLRVDYAYAMKPEVKSMRQDLSDIIHYYRCSGKLEAFEDRLTDAALKPFK